MIKISFVGDIMCELPLLTANKESGYEFDIISKELVEYLNKSDFVVGNLETPISKVGAYTCDLYCFNTPEKFLKQLKKSNFNLLMTSNNHCLDRGFSGLKKTMENIKRNNMNYLGTSLDGNNNFTIKINNKTITFFGYTYCTNYSYNKYKLNKNKEKYISMLKSQIDTDKNYGKYDRIKFQLSQTNICSFLKKIKHKLSQTNIYNFLRKIKHKLLRKNIIENNESSSIVWDNLNEDYWIIDDEYIKKIKEDINNNSSNIKIVMIHSGGQFNAEPGSFTKEIIKRIDDKSINAIIGTHPHVVQKCSVINKKMIAYSLGNFSISPSTVYLDHTLLPEYSILLNMVIDEENITYTFSILKAVEDDKHNLKVYFLSDLINNTKNNIEKEKLIKDNLFIYNRFTNQNKKNIKIEKEYQIG